MSKLVAIGHNMPGYLPEADVYVTHLDTDEDYANALSMMVEDMWRDGDFNLDVADDPTDEDAAGDAGMFELIDTASKRQSGEFWDDLMFSLRKYGEVDYRISWTSGDVSYWITATEETECSDEYCDICNPEGGE